MEKARTRKLISTLLILIMLLTGIPTAAAATKDENTAASMVAVAVSQTGYTESDNGYTKYGAAYGDSTMNWDVAFVLWCAKEAGISPTVIPNYLMIDSMRAFFSAKGTYNLSKSHGTSYTPKAGDIVFFSESSSVNSLTHIGVVEKKTDTGFTAVEGAYKGKVARVDYKNSDKVVIGFGSPDYSVTAAGDFDYKTGTYTLDATMNFRSVPNGTVIGQIPGATKVKVTSVTGIWGQVSYGGKTGWISLEYATPESSIARTYKTGVYRVNTTMSVMKTAGGTTKLKTVNAGTVLNVTSVNGEWGKVNFNGSTGWIELSFCTRFTSANNEPVVITVPASSTTVTTKVEIDPSKAQSVDWLVVDISKWNAVYQCDWAKMKAAGVKGVIIRIGGRGYAGARTIYSDDTFYQHYKNAKAAGLHVGAYFYSYALNEKEAKEEAQYTVNLLKKTYKCELDMPVYIDMEDYTGDWKHHNAGKAVCSKVLDAFCNVIAQEGYYPGIYTNLDFTKNLIEPSVLNGRTVWIAHYSNTCGYNGRYEMWQYSQYGKINGYTGTYIDLNRCYVNFPLLINSAYEQAHKTETITIPEHTTVVDPTHEAPNTTPAGGVESTTEAPPKVDDTPTVTRKWKTTKKATCTTDGEKCLYEGNTILLKEMITATHTKTVNCALTVSNIQLHAGDRIDPAEFSSNYYTESSPYYATICSNIKNNGGCKFSFC